MSFTPGQRFRLLRDHGNQAFDPVGGVRHGLPAGAIGTLAFEVAASERGAHNDHEDALVLEFADESRTIGASGSIETSSVTRRASFAIDAFAAGSPECMFELLG